MSEMWVLSSGSQIISGPMTFQDALTHAQPMGRTHMKPIPEKYLKAALSEARAEIIACEYINKHIEMKYAHLTFDPPRLRGDDAMRFMFFAFCHEWVANGKIPGAFTCSVDRIDGHIWSLEEFVNFEKLYELI